MEQDHHIAAETARKYFRSATQLVRLGWGISGFVYLSPDARTAVKVHYRQESFERELQVYRRLNKLKIIKIQGLTVPKLRNARRRIKLLQMDFVRPPYLLDFAGASFTPPDFSEETMKNWEEGIAEMFGRNAHIAYAVYNSLARLGIYYMDFRPSNMNLTGLLEASHD